MGQIFTLSSSFFDIVKIGRYGLTMTTTKTGRKPPPKKPKAAPYHHGDLRAALLEAAEKVLEESGIEGFSLRAVAKRAGVSHAAPAHHFKDTAGLLTALAAIGYRKFLRTQDAHRAKTDQSPRALLVASGTGYVEFARTHPALFRLMFSSNRTDYDNEELSALSEQAFHNLLQAVTELRGSDPTEDPAAMIDAMAAWSIVHGLADLMNAGRPGPIIDMPKKKQDEVIKAIIMRLYGNG